MPTVVVTRRDGTRSTLEVPGGLSLMQALRDAGVDEIQAVCGGCGSCATCHVYLGSAAWQHPLAPTAEESALLDCAESRQPNSRLACQVQVTDDMNGLEVVVAPEA